MSENIEIPEGYDLLIRNKNSKYEFILFDSTGLSVTGNTVTTQCTVKMIHEWIHLAKHIIENSISDTEFEEFKRLRHRTNFVQLSNGKSLADVLREI